MMDFRRWMLAAWVGASLGVMTCLPAASCACDLASVVCTVPICWVARSNRALVEIFMRVPQSSCGGLAHGQHSVKQHAGDLHHLGRGLVGLLKTD